MPDTLINVSNRLPVTVEEDRVTKSSGGLVAALEGLPEGQFKTTWIGWPGATFLEEATDRKSRGVWPKSMAASRCFSAKKKALPTEEKRNRILPMRERVMRYDARH